MPLADTPLLETENLERRFGAVRVLRGVSLTVRAGECHLVVGPNGAGKTTLLRVLAGLARPHAGTLRRAGGSRSLGFVSHQSLLYDELTPRENLLFVARLQGMRGAAARLVVEQRLAAFGLLERADEPVRRLSRGTAQRVTLARALLHDPALLLLDEPLTGLDALATEQALQLFAAERAAGRALVMVTHDPAEAWALATHAHVLVRGVWAFGGPRGASLEEFLARCREALRG